MSKSRFRILPDETYIIAVGDHNEEIKGIDILAILEAAFDEAAEDVDFIHLINDEAKKDQYTS